jgi:heat-inducible transcriptional repressor
MQLNEREKIILEALVELYVRDAGAVSSGALHRELGVPLSSASIRNVLHGLEEKGLLHQPHTSAGREPTRAGYRVYVDLFCRPLELPAEWADRIRSGLQLEPATQDVHEILERVSRLLAGLSSNVGVGLAIQDDPRAHIQRVELVPLEAQRILAVVTLDNGVVRTEVLGLDSNLPHARLDAAAQILNEIVGDRTPAAARQRLDAALRGRTGEGTDLARNLAAQKDRIFPDRSLPTLHLQGASQIVGQPEFSDPENLRLLVRILDHPESLESVLVEQGREAEASITIGVESQREELRPFSLVVARCPVAGLPGFIGILGPMRMRYSWALSLVSGVVEALRSQQQPRTTEAKE